MSISEERLPLISIIMPCYCNRETVGDSIRSVLSQTLADWELIAVDDGSPEEDYREILPFTVKNDRIRVIRKENGGVSSARNAGIHEARGEWLFFLDADDYLVGNALDTLLSMVTQKTDIICAAYEMDWGDGRKEYCKCAGKTIHEVRDSLIRGDSALNSMCARLYRTDMIRENRLMVPENISVGEDVLFNLEAFRCAREFRFLDESIYIYRRNEASAMAKVKSTIYESSLPMIRGIGEYLFLNQLSTEHFRAHLDIWLRTLRADRGRLKAAFSISRRIVKEICRGVNPAALTTKERMYYWALRICPCSSFLIP